jgi:hypothetical protein
VHTRTEHKEAGHNGVWHGIEQQVACGELARPLVVHEGCILRCHIAIPCNTMGHHNLNANAHARPPHRPARRTVNKHREGPHRHAVAIGGVRQPHARQRRQEKQVAREKQRAIAVQDACREQASVPLLLRRRLYDPQVKHGHLQHGQRDHDSADKPAVEWKAHNV